MFKSFEKYIKKIKSEKLQDYDDVSCTEDNIVRGTRYKQFVRCSSDVFEDLINELRNNPKCSYVTYMNDLIKSGYIPQFLSILKKEKRDDLQYREKDRYGIGHLADICASRILNYFECPTAYETMLDIDGEVFGCSVDFNNPDEDFYILSGLNNVWGVYGKNDLVESLYRIEDSLYAFKNNQFIQISESGKQNNEIDYEDMMKQYEEDYIYSWLIRVLVLSDSDFRFYNLGLIHNTKDNTIRMAPNFDFEYCFNDIREDVWTSTNMNNLKFIASNYPNVYKKFVDKLEQLLTRENGKSRCRKILESVVGNEERAKPFLEDFRKRLRELYNLITEFVPVREEL